MRIIRAILASLAVLALAVSPAFAGGKPVRDALPFPDQLVFGAGEPCPFAVQVDSVRQKEYGLTFFDAAGNPTRTLIYGQFVMTYTNLSSGKSVTLTESGPGEITYNADGSLTAIARGPSILFPPGLPFVHHEGLVTVRIDDSGFTIIDEAGRGLDICAVLA